MPKEFVITNEDQKAKLVSNIEDQKTVNTMLSMKNIVQMIDEFDSTKDNCDIEEDKQ